jgi:phosphoglycolate phosphatase-like HAD superfamily hydrolase
MARRLTTLVFDFDGVIASERRHWDSARLAVWELCTSPRYLGLANYFFSDAGFPAVFTEAKERVIPLECIAELKNRSVNSNWDITFLAASLHLIHLMGQLGSRPRWLSGHRGEVSSSFLAELGRELRGRGSVVPWDGDLMTRISKWNASTAHRLVEELNRTSRAVTGLSARFFRYRGGFWNVCQRLFQSWYTGAKLLEEPQLFVVGDEEECWQRPAPERGRGKPKGLRFPLRRAGTIVSLQRLRALFDGLRREGYVLAIATGRPRNELVKPLGRWDLLRYFDPTRLSTNDEVTSAEQRARAAGRQVQLSKPHPYAVLRALHPGARDSEIVRWSGREIEHPEALVIGDSVGDILAAKGAGCLALAVLSGMGDGAAIRARRRECLREAGADCVIESVAELPRVLSQIAS